MRSNWDGGGSSNVFSTISQVDEGYDLVWWGRCIGKEGQKAVLLGEDLDFSPESDLEQASRRHHLCSLLQKALVDKHIKHLKMFWPFPTWQIEIGLSFSSAIVLLFQLTIYQSLPWLCRSSRYCPSFFSYCFFLLSKVCFLFLCGLRFTFVWQSIKRRRMIHAFLLILLQPFSLMPFRWLLYFSLIFQSYLFKFCVGKGQFLLFSIHSFLMKLFLFSRLHSRCCESLFPKEAAAKCQASLRCQVSKVLHPLGLAISTHWGHV